MTEHEWLMKQIASEIIRERLGLELSDQNINRLAKLLHDFEAEVSNESNTSDLDAVENVLCHYGQLRAIKTGLTVHLEA